MTPTTTRTAATSSPSAAQLSTCPTAVVLEVTLPVYQCLWLSVFVVRCVSLLFLGAKAALYFFLSHPNMVYYASLLGPQAQPQFLPMGICLLLLSAAHGYKVSRMLFYSWSYGELVYEARAVETSDFQIAPRSVDALPAPPPQHGSTTRYHRWSRACSSALVTLFGSRGFFSVKSEYFDVQLALRECAEIVSQTLQLREASQLVVRHWVTNLYAVVVVVNCWSTPVVQYVCRHKVVVLDRSFRQIAAVLNGPAHGKPPKLGGNRIERQLQGLLALERLLCVATNVVLDLCTSIVIPAVILWPHVRSFDLATYNFPSTILYDDVRFVSLVNEMQQVFAVSVVEAITALFPHWGNYTGCESMMSLVTRQRVPTRRISARKTGVRLAAVRPGPSVDGTQAVDECARAPEPASKPSSTWIRSSRVPIVDRVRKLSKSNLVHVLFFLWGLVVLGLHTHAISRATTDPGPGCKQVLRPWLTSKTACSIFEFNCYANESTTVAEDAFEDLDKSSLAALIVSHCSALVVPSSIQDFPNLIGFEIYNSTIVEWNKSASFSLTDQRRLAYIQILRTNMTRFPEGLTTKLPPNLMDIEVSISNLTTLPEDLDVFWPPMAIVYFEYCALTSFPVVLSRIEVADLSLVGNRISSLITPGINDWSRVKFGTVGLGYTPMRQLPMTPIGSLEMLRSVTVEATELETLPAWMIEAAQAQQVKVYLKNSVFCLDQSEDIVMEQFGAGAYLTCVDEDPRGNGSVPIHFISSHRSLVRDRAP